MSRYYSAPQTHAKASLLSQSRGTVKNGPWEWESDDDEYTYGEETEAEAEDPADYSVNQFINTDDVDDDDDDSKNDDDDDDTSDNNDVGDFGMDEASDEK